MTTDASTDMSTRGSNDMSSARGGGTSGRTGRPARTVGAVLLALAGPLALAACSTSSPTVASLGPTTTTTAAVAAASGAPGRAQPEKFSSCMRAHGVTNFPDPVVNGNKVSISINPSISGNPHFASAQQACSYLMPKLAQGRPQPLTPQQQQDYLRAAACMRTHGFPNFADPDFSGGGVHLTLPPGIDQSSPGVARAIHTCQKLIPRGLPYSGT